MGPKLVTFVFAGAALAALLAQQRLGHGRIVKRDKRLAASLRQAIDDRRI